MERKRIVELDWLRAIAIFLMVVFHLVFDLKEFAGVDIDYGSPFWYSVGKASALLFIFVSGISSCLGRRTWRRGFVVLGFGMVVTVVTFVFLREEYIRFGILHFLGVAMLLSICLRRLGKLCLATLAAGSAIIGIWAGSICVNTWMLVPMGFLYDGFVSLDYYPLFPYLSMFILGILTYKIWYGKGKRILDERHSVRWIELLSRHSLSIYLVHQPLLLAFVWLVQYII